jgi:neutral ceramidase
MSFASPPFLFLFTTVLAGVALTGAGCRTSESATAPSRLNIGAAEIDITPPSPYRMAGYFDERLSTGVHDPLKAKALVLHQGREEFAWVFCDLIGLSLNITTNARAESSRLTGIPVSHIMICATHSHTGPLFDDVRRNHFHKAALAKSGTDPYEPVFYPTFLTERLVKVIAEAKSKSRPAQLEVAITNQPDTTFNRRYWMKNGKVAFNPGQLNPNIVRPAGPVDSSLTILQARDSQSDRPFAGITVFAMHSDTVGGTEFSADYEYFLQQTLRGQYGESYISAFGAGTCGDLNHINVNKKEPFKGFAMAEHLGASIGKTELAAEHQLAPLEKPSFSVRSTIVQAPLQQVTAEQIANARSNIEHLGDPNTDFFTKVIATKNLDLAERGSPYPMEVQVFRLNADDAIVCLPGEIFVELGLAIKNGSPFKNTVVISICNDRPSYVPTSKAFAEGSYEVTNSRVSPGTGEMLVDAALKLLKELK